MNVLERVQQITDTTSLEELRLRVIETARQLERVPADLVPGYAAYLVAFICLHDEELLRWVINGTPVVHTVTTADNLQPRDYAG